MKKTVINRFAIIALFTCFVTVFTDEGRSATSDPGIDIKINGKDGSYTFEVRDSTANLFLNVFPDSINGTEADWWLVAVSTEVLKSYSLSEGWIDGLVPTYQGPAFHLEGYSIPFPDFATGNYTFYLGIDTIQNGTVDFDQLYSDTVEVQVNNAANNSKGEAEEAPLDLSQCTLDIHQHFSAGDPFSVGAETLVERMSTDSENAFLINQFKGLNRAIIFPPPESGDPANSFGSNYTYNTGENPTLLAAVQMYPDQLSFGGGGGLLNPLIHAASLNGSDGDEAAFRSLAQGIADDGAKVFGEMAVLHISYKDTHPFIEIEANHKLYKVLVEVAADYDIPVDIHIEAVDNRNDLHPTLKIPEELLPAISHGSTCFQNVEGVGELKGNNPTELQGNIVAFENLLDYGYTYACENLQDCTRSKIVWSHVGWDNTGDLTASLVSDLMDAHPNLYAALKMLDNPGKCQTLENRPLDKDGELRADWKTLFEKHPDRFVIGGDEFTGASSISAVGSPSVQGTWDVINKLPTNELKKKIACDNSRDLYGL